MSKVGDPGSGPRKASLCNRGDRHYWPWAPTSETEATLGHEAGATASGVLRASIGRTAIRDSLDAIDAIEHANEQVREVLLVLGSLDEKPSDKAKADSLGEVYIALVPVDLVWGSVFCVHSSRVKALLLHYYARVERAKDALDSLHRALLADASAAEIGWRKRELERAIRGRNGETAPILTLGEMAVAEMKRFGLDD